jgi:hypothetical protein
MNGEFSSTSDLKSSAHSRLRVFLDSVSQGRAQTGIVEGGAKMTRVLDEKTPKDRVSRLYGQQETTNRTM